MDFEECLEKNSEYVTESGCRIWNGRVSSGYGYIRYKGKKLAVHRIAWAVVHGPIPKGICVCHKCDVGLCTNDYHLFLGTHADNMADAKNKGRLKCSPATREKLRAAQTGKKASSEARAKMSKSQTGKQKSPEHRAKIGLAHKGAAHFLGHRHTEETKAKISLARRGTRC